MLKRSAYLRDVIRGLNGRGYKAYKALEGEYEFPWYRLSIDHVQGDPFASLSRLTLIIPIEKTGLPKEFFTNKLRAIALCDFLTRMFREEAEKFSHRCGTGHSCQIYIEAGRQEVLERNSIILHGNILEVRFFVGLPAYGRSILAHAAEEIILHHISKIAEKSLIYKNLEKRQLEEHIYSYEDQEILRQRLSKLKLVAFIREGAVLPRKSGIEDRPLKDAIPFICPKELKIEIELPYRGRISGMGIPLGVTLIVGGGFHGKSTLLQAIERGVYSHIPGDGREYVVTDPRAIKIRAEDGRSVVKVNISPFINNLPLGKNTYAFFTENASGSTSQAANIIEALEIGAKVLLIDEDTSATNFMIRDKRMQLLVKKEKEPIFPFIDRIRQLYADFGVSTILVMGGCGDYFDVADTVITMDTYRPHLVTEEAREIARKYNTGRINEGGEKFGNIRPRRPLPESFNPRRGGKIKIEAKGLKTIVFGRQTIDLSALEQLVDIGQTRAIGHIINYYATNHLKNTHNLKEGLERTMADIEKYGLDIVLPYRVGNLARPRIEELAGAINRLRSLKV